MSYYLDLADKLEKGETLDPREVAQAIRELYQMKQELERMVKIISDARDLLIKGLP